MSFSVIMCVWKNDDPGLFQKAMSSCFQQSLPPQEFVLVIDGEISDDLETVVCELKNSCLLAEIDFVLHRFGENMGHGMARRAAMELANHRFIAICDADDINEKHRFSEEYDFLQENPEISVVGGFIKEVSENQAEDFKIRRVPKDHNDITSYLRFRCPMNQMTVMFRKDDVISVGGYMDFYHNEDYFLWCRLISAGKKFANIQKVLVRANVSANTYVRRSGFHYFISESKIQLLLLKLGLTNSFLVIFNVLGRFLVQLCCPNVLRQWLFDNVFRTNK